MTQRLGRLSRNAVLVFSGDILGLHVVEGILGTGRWLPVLVDVDKRVDERVQFVLTQLHDQQTVLCGYRGFLLAERDFKRIPQIRQFHSGFIPAVE